MRIPMAILSFVFSGALRAADDVVKLHLVPTGGSALAGHYLPLRLTLTSRRPVSLVKTPALAAPRYATIAMASDGGRVFHVVLDEPPGQPARLYVDGNGNGDLTDDEPAEWNARNYAGEGGRKFVQYSGAAQVKLGSAGPPFDVGLRFYRFDPADPHYRSEADVLYYYRDYVTAGELTVAGKRYAVLLSDRQASGDFRGRPLAANAPPTATSGVQLLIDLDGDRRFSTRDEAFDVRRPFNLGGTTYEIADLKRDGSSFRLIRSAHTVAPTIVPPALTKGGAAPAFEAVTTDGRRVKFPGDFPGQIVLLQFWSSSSPASLLAVRGAADAYQKFRARGFEVLGVSRDDARSRPRFDVLTRDLGLPFRQVFDGAQRNEPIAKLYRISVVPANWLVDGSTGAILALDPELRGTRLAATLDTLLPPRNDEVDGLLRSVLPPPGGHR